MAFLLVLPRRSRTLVSVKDSFRAAGYRSSTRGRTNLDFHLRLYLNSWVEQLSYLSVHPMLTKVVSDDVRLEA